MLKHEDSTYQDLSHCVFIDREVWMFVFKGADFKGTQSGSLGSSHGDHTLPFQVLHDSASVAGMPPLLF